MGHVKSSEIACFLDSKLYGSDLLIYKCKSLYSIEANVLLFSNKINIDINEKLLILVPLSFDSHENNFSYIKVKNPRISFAKVIDKFFLKKINYKVENTVKIGRNCKIAKNVKIGHNCVLSNNIIVEEHTIIANNVIISDNVRIGKSCYIKSNTVIGEDGFGFDFEEDGTPFRIPHIGSVYIGNNVEIGAQNTIARGTLDNTIIEDNVKTDDQVHIAHNCKIGKNTLITACVEISGSVEIGANCWIGPNSSIIQKIKIEDNVTIGIGTIVIKDVAAKKKIMALEGLSLRNLLKLKKRIKFGE